MFPVPLSLFGCFNQALEFLACVGVVWGLSIVHEDTPGLNLEPMTLRFGNGVFYSGRGVASLVLDDCVYIQVSIYQPLLSVNAITSFQLLVIMSKY